MAIATKIEQGDIVRIPGCQDELKVFWIYSNGQVELLFTDAYRRAYPDILHISQLELVRKALS